MQTETVSYDKQATWAHVLPYVGWLAAMYLLGEAAGWKYACRVAAGLALLLALRPWRWYEGLRPRHVLPALGVGVLVFVLWVLPETAWAGQWPRLQRFYLTVGIQPPYEALEPVEISPYDPAVCGWVLTLVRLLGSAVVIAVIEEFFWRGFLYRWLVKSNFLSVPLDTLKWGALLLTAVFFASVHARWVVGFLAGILYGLFAIRTRDIWATSLAHGVTNLLLGFYVLWAGRYEFW